MDLSITAAPTYRTKNISFASNKNVQRREAQKDANPISRKGEVANLLKATFLGGVLLGGRLLLELITEGEFAIESIGEAACKIVDKNKKNLSSEKRALCKLGAFSALVGAGIAGFALLYTAFKAPNIAYQSKVNTFKNSKEMDVYIKANQAEKGIYEQLADKAKTADSRERDKLKSQYAQMSIAKNELPNLIKPKVA